ncbi:MAG: glycosyltransferase family 2 protein [Selenomonadaceae bacterium]|nr:glycosyltransferase family 2 protein [Selenomonadaceae bacterium]
MEENFFIHCPNENHWRINDANRADEKIISLKDEYKKYWQKIIAGENFALVRYADGERLLMFGTKIKSQEGWHAPECVTRLGADLRKSLGLAAPNFVYAISCPCCDSEAYYWYMNNLRGCNVTFSNIWINANFATFWEDFNKLERDAVLVTNYRGKGKKFGRLNIKKHYFIDDECVNFWEQEGQSLIQKIISDTGHEKNLLYAVSAGPMSGLIIRALYENNPDNCYIDFGSALDIFIHNKITRLYMVKDTPYANQNCWMFNREKVNFDVDVVLSAYKRPQVLAQQFEAIKNQTLKPRRIFLYQDAVKAGEPKVVLDEKILSQLDGYEIATENGGVWKRFEYAAEKTLSPYVCIFDDDTIPGRRWLENCHMHMEQFSGVYGTNGIILIDINDYPEEYTNVGWHLSNERTFEVDFVGHSWFVRRKYLNWMLEKPYKNRYKYSSEDMCLSYACLEHGVKTYVPAHPKNILSLWGSIPEYGIKYGNESVAVSSNAKKLSAMKVSLIEMHNDGWKILFERNRRFIQKNSAKVTSESFCKNVDNLIKILNEVPTFFMGEKKYFETVKMLLGLDYSKYIVIDEDNIIEGSNLLTFLKPNEMYIIFADCYDQIKEFLELVGMKENQDFMNGKILLTD